MDIAEQIVGSPRGRRVCANLVAECNSDFLSAVWDATEVSTGDRSARVVAAVATAGPDVIGALSEEAMMRAVAEAAAFARYWQEPDDIDRVYAHRSVVAALRPIAAALLAAPGIDWLASPADRTNQRWVQWWHRNEWYPKHPQPPDSADLRQWRDRAVADEERARWERPVDPSANVSGEWWSTPATTQRLATSRALPLLGAVQLALMEDSMGWDRARVWPGSVAASVRVFEIDAPDDWARLVEAYPLCVSASRRHDWYRTVGRDGDWFIPDWAAVAADYAAVHLSLLGYLTTPGRAIEVADGATMLAGWDPDVTYWLRDGCITVGDKEIEWLREDDRWRSRA
ncbi:hypothetical protein [Nocardia sp. NPDC049149]|uniref:hypothetical protein n=1 Tax=Nocardia sp. NPDC049149 TaxID=3364315 RepID=UPI00371CE9BD